MPNSRRDSSVNRSSNVRNALQRIGEIIGRNLTGEVTSEVPSSGGLLQMSSDRFESFTSAVDSFIQSLRPVDGDSVELSLHAASMIETISRYHRIIQESQLRATRTTAASKYVIDDVIMMMAEQIYLPILSIN